MSPERVGVHPVLKEDKVKGILSVKVNGVKEAPRFLARAAHVLQAEREDLLDAVRSSPDTTGHDDHAETLASSAAWLSISSE